MDNEELYTTIDYQFEGGLDSVVFLEEICNSLGINVEKYWYRELDEINVFTGENITTSRTKPLVAELYNLTYSLLISNQQEAKNKFAEFLIDSMLETCGYLEGCLKQEMEENNGGKKNANKKRN